MGLTNLVCILVPLITFLLVPYGTSVFLTTQSLINNDSLFSNYYKFLLNYTLGKVNDHIASDLPMRRSFVDV
jgi:hypothetical protein